MLDIKDINKKLTIINNKMGVLVDDGPENTDQILILNGQDQVYSEQLLELGQKLIDSMIKTRDDLNERI